MHNLFSASQFYDNITCKQLGAMLEIPVLKVKNIISQMIMKGRLNALVGHSSRFEHFYDQESLTL